MDVREMADHYISKVHDRRIDYDEDIFIAGYNAACEWFPMIDAPKQKGFYILIIDEKGIVNICDWRSERMCDDLEYEDKKWCIKEGWMDHICYYHTIKNPVAWMPIPKYTHTQK